MKIDVEFQIVRDGRYYLVTGTVEAGEGTPMTRPALDGLHSLLLVWRDETPIPLVGTAPGELTEEEIEHIRKMHPANRRSMTCGAVCHEHPAWVCERDIGHPGRHEGGGGDWH